MTAARAAFPGWSATPVDQRAEVLNKIADIIEKNGEDYKKSITLEQGKPVGLYLLSLRNCFQPHFAFVVEGLSA